MAARSRLRVWLTAAIAAVPLLLCAVLSPAEVLARNPAATVDIAVAALPREARQTLQLIRKGGPYPHERDDVTFGNYERLLPQHERGYYREYTVPTPGAGTRGARRIVAGRSGEYYYSADHYRSFRRIRE